MSNPLPYPFLVIRASAGTGKTYRLSSRYIGLLERDVPVDQILATTFTKKAAGEILERILVRLAKAADSVSQRQELAESLSIPALSGERCLELLARLVRNLHRLRVSTLDSFFGQLATTHALELELPPGWQIADQHALDRLERAAIAALLENNPDADVLRLMHLVGKGDGGRRVTQLIESTVRNLHEKFQGSDEAAWQQVGRHKPLEPSELAELLDEMAETPLPGHKGAVAAHAKSIALAQQEDWQSVIDGGLVAKVLDGETTYQRKDIPPETVARYQKLVEHVRAVLTAQLANQNQGTYDLLRKYDDECQRLKTELRMLGFGDVKHALARRTALADDRRWAFRMDGRITHLLLDEFQDTAPDQWQVIEPVARLIVSGQNSSFFCVGDTKQAIYGWRGGEARIFSALEPRLGELQEESLARSYRSAQPIVDATNAIFGNLLNHNKLEDYEPAVRAWCREFEPHETRWQLRQGYVTLETGPLVDEKLQKDATLAFAADRIARHVDEIPHRSIGVLVRTNDAVGRMIYELGRRNIPASEEGDTPITDSAAVGLILSLVRWLDHPADTIAAFHVVTSPLAAAIEFPTNASRTRQAVFAAELRTALATDGYGRTVSDWAERLVAHSSRREAGRLRQLSRLAYDYQPLATLRPSDFVDYVRRRKVAAPESVRVRVMTIHQAKGLEFDIVVLPQLDEKLIGQPATVAIGRQDIVGPIDAVCLHRDKQFRKLLPRRLQQMFDDDTAQQIAEALCRLYVSVTRPKYALHMIVAPSKANEKNLPKTPAGLLRAALVSDGPFGELATHYALGDANWYEHEREGLPQEDDIEKPAAEPPARVVRLAKSPAARRRPWTSPSQLEGGSLRRPAAAFALERRTATRRGTVLHAMFEQVKWLDDDSADDTELYRVALRFGVTESESSELVAEFRHLLAVEPIARVLSRASYQSHHQSPVELEVRCEQRIAARSDQHLLSGAIDRLVLIRRDGELVAADVIDFKTDALLPDDGAALAGRVAYYRPQIDAYRHAVATMFRLGPERVAGRLVFTSLETVVEM